MGIKIEKEGNVRIDLLGGTLDLWPINVAIPKAVTLNMAIDLKAQVSLEEMDGDDILIESKDYQKTYRFQKGQDLNDWLDDFPEMSFIVQLLRGLDRVDGLKLVLESGSPPGAGLGGSSAMGMALVFALDEFLQLGWPGEKMVRYVQNIEAKILHAGPAGYQDYYPALHGGILALRQGPCAIEVEQLFHSDSKHYLEDWTTLVYSGLARRSGINNWEVYKGFFDGKKSIVDGLGKIADLSDRAYESFLAKDFPTFLSLMAKEGEHRMELFPSIVPTNVKKLVDSLENLMGFKMCGAGGGGCFLLIHPPVMKGKVIKQVEKFQMKVLDYHIVPPFSHR
ncbi:MAG: hypothetical protein OXB88_01015 [Bacteriovoracales bacterium]|nr:hypothetical protein [Bacteriovoracales bacterium]